MRSKLFETVMRNQLVNFLESNNLFMPIYFGFGKGRSTSATIGVLLELINKAFKSRDSVALTLLDLSKAFDCVSQTILLAKLALGD